MRKLEGRCARRPGVDALGQHLHGQHPAHDAAQRGRPPELLIVAAAGVEAHDEARRAQASASAST